ncbi:MAG TPA: hydrogenase maturation protease [Steroidobacteraceae bacterium]|nr:hydrogenase maturation protease [Steroidobacteraceae bacterium]
MAASDAPAHESGAAGRGGVLVLGLGNVLLGDDGIGAAALDRLERDYRIPPEVRLVEGGTLGLSLLDEIAEAQHAVLVDAVAVDAPPGTLVRLDGAAVIDAVRDRLSVHQVGVADLLDAARLIGRYPSSVVLLGLVPGLIGLGVGRTRVVDEALEALIPAILREIQTLGYELIPRPQECAGDRPIHALTRHFGM